MLQNEPITLSRMLNYCTIIIKMPKINKNKRLILHWIPLFTRNISELEFQKYSANYEVSQSNIQKKTTNVQS